MTISEIIQAAAYIAEVQGDGQIGDSNSKLLLSADQPFFGLENSNLQQNYKHAQTLKEHVTTFFAKNRLIGQSYNTMP